jgi:hypothetical protein
MKNRNKVLCKAKLKNYKPSVITNYVLKIMRQGKRFDVVYGNEIFKCKDNFIGTIKSDHKINFSLEGSAEKIEKDKCTPYPLKYSQHGSGRDLRRIFKSKNDEFVRFTAKGYDIYNYYRVGWMQGGNRKTAHVRIIIGGWGNAKTKLEDNNYKTLCEIKKGVPYIKDFNRIETKVDFANKKMFVIINGKEMSCKYKKEINKNFETQELDVFMGVAKTSPAINFCGDFRY